jgi:hypothetical protein
VEIQLEADQKRSCYVKAVQLALSGIEKSGRPALDDQEITLLRRGFALSVQEIKRCLWVRRQNPVIYHWPDDPANRSLTRGTVPHNGHWYNTVLAVAETLQ